MSKKGKHGKEVKRRVHVNQYPHHGSSVLDMEIADPGWLQRQCDRAIRERDRVSSPPPSYDASVYKTPESSRYDKGNSPFSWRRRLS